MDAASPGDLASQAVVRVSTSKSASLRGQYFGSDITTTSLTGSIVDSSLLQSSKSDALTCV